MPDHHCLFRRLSTDLGSSRSVAAERVLAIATRGPALLGCATPADVVARCLDRADRAAANGALRALVRAGGEDLFARRLALIALAPGLASVSHGLAARWRADLTEVDQAAAAVAWERMGDPALGEATWPACELLDAVTARLRWLLTCDAKRCLRTGGALAAEPPCAGDGFAAAEARLDGAQALATAVRAGRLSPLAARVVWATRYEGRTTDEVGAVLGRSAGSVRVLRSRAERALGLAG